MPERATPPLAPEAIVTLRDEAGVLVRWYCTPEHLEDLTAGWLLGEGRVARIGEMGPLRIDTAGRQVWLEAPDGDVRSSTTPASGAERAPKMCAALAEDSDTLRDLFSRMFDSAMLRERSGGIHTGALVTGGEIRLVREDVSRHCVVDKLVGRAALDGLSLDDALLLLSGRISGAIAAKGARAGVAAMATMSIPTTLAAETAARAGLTLLGRSRSASPHLYPPARSDTRS